MLSTGYFLLLRVTFSMCMFDAPLNFTQLCSTCVIQMPKSKWFDATRAHYDSHWSTVAEITSSYITIKFPINFYLVSHFAHAVESQFKG